MDHHLRTAFHQLVNRVADETARPGLHAAIDALDDALIPEAFAHMRAIARAARHRRARRARKKQSPDLPEA